MFRPLAVSILLLAAALPARASETLLVQEPPVLFTEAPAPPLMASAFALPAASDGLVDGPELSLLGRHHAAKPKKAVKPSAETMPLGPERARILLRSLTVPGWGQATVGRRHAAAFFGVAELGVWTAFTSFRVQELLRREGYERTAKIFAGIDVTNRDDEYRRIVGAFGSSDEYNLYVVARDAANLYMSDPYKPDLAAYRAYIAAHSITGSDGWHWTDRASFDRYRAQRKNAQRASLRANTALGLAIANRIVSAVHAMRASGHAIPAPSHGTSWKFELTPGSTADPAAVRAGLSASF